MIFILTRSTSFELQKEGGDVPVALIIEADTSAEALSLAYDYTDITLWTCQEFQDRVFKVGLDIHTELDIIGSIS